MYNRVFSDECPQNDQVVRLGEEDGRKDCRKTGGRIGLAMEETGSGPDQWKRQVSLVALLFR